jgi:hypothetical protein
MLRKLVLHNVGPAKDLALDPVAPHLNLLTGDNGLGKSFLLEAAWWALTRTWHETPAVPSAPDAVIEHEFDGESKLSQSKSEWMPDGQFWKREPGRPPNPGLVMYARVDGSFSVHGRTIGWPTHGSTASSRQSRMSWIPSRSAKAGSPSSSARSRRSSVMRPPPSSGTRYSTRSPH